MKRFKYLKKINIFIKLKTVLQRLKQLEQKPSSMFLYWILDTLEYGIVGFIAFFLTKKLGVIGFGLSIGLFVYLLKLTIKDILSVFQQEN